MIIPLDIETAPIGWREAKLHGVRVPPEVVRAYQAKALTAAPPKNYSRPETIERWRQQQHATAVETARAAWSKGSLDPKHGEILCVGVAVDDGAPLVIWGDTEQDTLELTLTWLRVNVIEPAYLISHNGRGFDWPYIWERATAYGLTELARIFYDAPYRIRREMRLPPREITLVDTRDLWNTTTGSTRSLLGICNTMRVSSGDDRLHGGLVLDALLSGDSEAIATHCETDIRRLQALWYDHLAPSLFGPIHTQEKP